MKFKRFTETFAGRLSVFIVAYLILALIFAWVALDDWKQTAVETDSVSMGYLLPAGVEVAQTFSCPMDTLEQLTITPHFDQAERAGALSLRLSVGESELWTGEVEAAGLASDASNVIAITPALENIAGQTLTLTIDPRETGAVLWAGTTMSAGKFDVSVEVAGLTVQGSAAEGGLVFSASGYRLLQGAQWYWPAVLAILALSTAVILLTHFQLRKGKRSVLTIVVLLVKQYSYLLKQLVWRDFRVKYKASLLGMLWSFLNPLLTMMVYFVVFSTIFRSDIEYFPVYLMSGIVLFNFYSEATSLGLLSIVGNGALITKVYMPKIIYPLSKVLSASINLCISFLPLLGVMLFTGVPFSKSLLLLPVVVCFLTAFCLGMSLILSTLNVFFRDTQFLWSVLLTMWNFLTPIFYPESIIPDRFMTIYRLNPMYHIVSFMRSITIGGVSPEPMAYLLCLIMSVVPLLIGLLIFRRNQDRFVLYL